MYGTIGRMLKEKGSGRDVAVVGGGIFGCTAAVELARAGFSVTLFEKEDDLFRAASGINQYRTHRGYHYPRSSDTITSCKSGAEAFEERYADAVISHFTHHYAIAKEQSLTNGEQFCRVCNEHDLPYQIVQPEFLNNDMLDVCVVAEENVFDPTILKQLCIKDLTETGVAVKLGTKVTAPDLDSYDFVVLATYAALNELVSELTGAQQEYQYEVCEKILVEIPKELEGVSLVVMDGPFFSFDPYGTSGYAVMGHVEHAIHKRTTGVLPDVPDDILPLLNRGVIESPPVTNAPAFLAAASQFVPALSEARHVGSMFTVRTVLPRVDASDERPTIVRPVTDRVVSVYSGKIVSSVSAAKQLVDLFTKAAE